MPGSLYIESADYAAFGLPSTMTEALVRQASTIIDQYLARPGGLVWSPDATGAPAYQDALTTSLSLAVGSGGIIAGSNVVVPYSGPALDNNSVGEVVIVDRTVGNKIEACVISAVTTGPNTVTLATVQFDHDPGAKMEFGLVLNEQKELPNNRPITRLSDFPVMSLLSGVGRYGYGRRSDQIMGSYQDFNLLAVVSNFGGPPLWIPWIPTDASINRLTGELWVPAGILLAYYTEIRVWYVAGYQRSALPYNIKIACASIAVALSTTGLGPNIRSRNQKDGVGSQKFENNVIDANTRNMLDPYHARTYA